MAGERSLSLIRGFYFNQSGNRQDRRQTEVLGNRGKQELAKLPLGGGLVHPWCGKIKNATGLRFGTLPSSFCRRETNKAAQGASEQASLCPLGAELITHGDTLFGWLFWLFSLSGHNRLSWPTASVGAADFRSKLSSCVCYMLLDSPSCLCFLFQPCLFFLTCCNVISLAHFE